MWPNKGQVVIAKIGHPREKQSMVSECSLVMSIGSSFIMGQSKPPEVITTYYALAGVPGVAWVNKATISQKTL